MMLICLLLFKMQNNAYCWYKLAFIWDEKKKLFCVIVQYTEKCVDAKQELLFKLLKQPHHLESLHGFSDHCSDQSAKVSFACYCGQQRIAFKAGRLIYFQKMWLLYQYEKKSTFFIQIFLWPISLKCFITLQWTRTYIQFCSY